MADTKTKTKTSKKNTTNAACENKKPTANKTTTASSEQTQPVNEVVINGVTYVPKPAVMAKNDDDLPFVLIRTYSAGVHIGYLKNRDGSIVTLLDSRRIWSWVGAFTCSELAMYGVSAPAASRLSTTVPEIILTEAVEIIPCTEDARACFLAIPDFTPPCQE